MSKTTVWTVSGKRGFTEVHGFQRKYAAFVVNSPGPYDSTTAVDSRWIKFCRKEDDPDPDKKISKTINDLRRSCMSHMRKSNYYFSGMVWMHNRTLAIFAMNLNPDKGVESKIFGIPADSGGPRLIATLPMKIDKIHVFGTRVLCYSTVHWKQNGDLLQGEEHRKKAVIIFDVWDPDSVRRGDVRVTKMADISSTS